MPADRSTTSTRVTTRRRRWPGALVAVAVLAVLAVLAAPAPAALAHDELLGIAPARGATVPASPAQVELALGAPAQELGTEVVVTGADGGAVSQGTVELRGTTVVVPLRADLPAGTYTVAWRVTSSDGHPLVGTSTFTVAAAPAPPSTADRTSTAPTAAGPGGPAASASGEDPTSRPSPAVLAGGVGLLVAAAGLGARQLRRRS
jgi:hypothetical protein